MRRSLAGHRAERNRNSPAGDEKPDLSVAFDSRESRPKASGTMKKNPCSTLVASFLALAVVASVVPAFASSPNDAQPQCGDDKKESKGGDKKDDKSSDTKPKPPVQG